MSCLLVKVGGGLKCFTWGLAAGVKGTGKVPPPALRSRVEGTEQTYDTLGGLKFEAPCSYFCWKGLWGARGEGSGGLGIGI